MAMATFVLDALRRDRPDMDDLTRSAAMLRGVIRLVEAGVTRAPCCGRLIIPLLCEHGGERGAACVKAHGASLEPSQRGAR